MTVEVGQVWRRRGGDEEVEIVEKPQPGASRLRVKVAQERGGEVDSFWIYTDYLSLNYRALFRAPRRGDSVKVGQTWEKPGTRPIEIKAVVEDRCWVQIAGNPPLDYVLSVSEIWGHYTLVVPPPLEPGSLWVGAKSVSIRDRGVILSRCFDDVTYSHQALNGSWVSCTHSVEDFRRWFKPYDKEKNGAW